MSSSSPPPPDFDRVEKGVNLFTTLPSKLSTFVRDIAGWIRKRQWLELLMLVVAIAVLFLLFKAAIDHYFKNGIPYFDYVFGAIVLVFFLAVIIESRKKPPLKFVSRDVGKRKAIKFLSSFEQEDAEIFARLRGYRDLEVILENIVHPDFNFGILKGKSGCGKSSYLKAGLLAELAKTETHRGVYIKFSNLDSLQTIREAFIDSLNLPKQEIESLNFLELLNKAMEAASQSCQNFKSLILIFDQFEQFFIYTDDQARREAFIQDLATWYNNDELTDKIKILISIREDWFARMDEIQQSLDYTLRTGSHMGGNSFYLKNFSAEEASIILAVMAKEDLGIEENDVERFDSPYIQEILERDLASPTDRLISPVDLQIIAETIKQQNTSETRSFNRKALQRLGGIEGLRRSFLESILEDLGTERKKLAVQVLVSLTNLEQQTRAEVKTLAQLQDKVKGIVSSNEVESLVIYLQGVGLISAVERDGIKGYELAHEGMISAVIRSGEQIQDKAYRANQLLERRVNEWLGNNRSSRYLFNLKELWSIEQQKPYLIWGSKRQQKQKLLEQSKRRIYGRYGSFGGVLLLGMGIWGGLNYTPWGQLTQIRWRLADVSQQISNAEHKVIAVAAFAKDENFSQASKLANQIKDYSALRAIAEAYSKLNQPEKAADLLAKALTSANQIKDSSNKASALSAIAEAYSKLNQPEKAADLLAKTLTSANQIENSYFKANTLSAIAEAIGKLKQPEKAADLLAKALTSANQIEDSSDKADALSAIAEAIGKLNQPEKAADLLAKALTSANQIEDSSNKASDKVSALSAIAEAYSKLNQPEKAADLLAKTLTSANQIENSYFKVSALSAIAEAIGKLKQPEKAADLLAKALTSANQIEDSSDKTNTLSAIAEAIGKLKQPEKAADLLAKALTSANQIEDSSNKASDKASALRAIAEAISKLNQPEKAADLLAKALTSANQIKDSSNKASALSAIAEAYSKLNQPEKAADLLAKALTSANQIEDSYFKANTLSAIAEAIGKLKQPEKAADLLAKALTSANQIEDSSDKADALSAIAEAIGKLNQPEKAADLLAKALTSANQIQDSTNKTYALSAIAEAYSKLNQPEKAVDLLAKALTSANQIQDSTNKTYALSAIAEAEASLKNWGKVLEVTQQCPGQDCKVDSLARALTVYAEQEHPK
ncbi:MAG: tetratricopeptide repeat protein [Pleurocapsa minor HA4230-MV1]|jgi:tetratricopeptide (TPR) repeat protein|nr:tetratricopeptide repeat protein [Pleurocapsa minor HA4230-MV1]